MAHRRPYRPDSVYTAPLRADGPPPPIIGRHRLPGGPPAYTSVLRFVLQITIVATFGVVTARVFGNACPKVGAALFGWISMSLLAVAFFKWVWNGRGETVPLIYVATIALGLLIFLGTIASSSTPLAVIGPGVVPWVMLIAVGGMVAKGLDAVTKSFDATTTLGLAGGSFVLLLVTIPPDSVPALRVLLTFELVVVIAFTIAITWVHGGYMLANPAHSSRTIEAARLWWEDEMFFTMIAGPILVVHGVVGLHFGPFDWLLSQAEDLSRLHSRPAAAGGGFDETGALIMTGLCTSLLALLAWEAYSISKHRRVLWQHIAVWLLYDGAPTPGIYRPQGWLGSLRFRQGVFAAVIFAQVLLVRGALGAVDRGILFDLGYCIRVVADGTPSQQKKLILGFLLSALSFVYPLLAIIGVSFPNPDTRKLYRQLEEPAPEDLYPAPENRS